MIPSLFISWKYLEIDASLCQLYSYLRDSSFKKSKLMLYYFTLSSPAFKILVFHLYFPVMISLFIIFMNLWIEMYLMMKSVPVTIIIEVQIASLWPARTCLSLLLSSFD